MADYITLIHRDDKFCKQPYIRQKAEIKKPQVIGIAFKPKTYIYSGIMTMTYTTIIIIVGLLLLFNFFYKKQQHN